MHRLNHYVGGHCVYYTAALIFIIYYDKKSLSYNKQMHCIYLCVSDILFLYKVPLGTKEVP